MPRSSTPIRRAGATTVVTLLVGLVALAAGCGSSDTGSSDTTTPATATAPTSTTEAPIVPATTDPPGTTRFNVYWLRDCPPAEEATEVGSCRLAVGESRTTTEPDILTAALVALGEGPNEDERSTGLTSNIRPIVHLNGVTVDGDTAVVDYNRYFETATTRPQVAQVVYTLTQFPSITAVRFLIDSAPNGATGTRPTNRGGVLELAPPVLVEAPALFGIVSPTFAVTGTLAAADVTFTARVVAADGTTLADATGGALAGSTAAPPPFLLRIAAPPTAGDAVLVVTAADGAEVQVPIRVQSG